MKRPPFFCLIAALWGVVAVQGAAAQPSAFSLIKEGNKYIGEQCKDKVVQIRSERSVGSLVPNIWYVVYYDPTATLKATEVKFGAGKMMDVKRPFRLLEPVTGGDKTLERKKFKVDSDRALAIALKEPLLNGLKLRATQYWLEHGDPSPYWRIRFWAAKINEPDKMADVGEVFVTLDTGEIIHDDLHPNSIE